MDRSRPGRQSGHLTPSAPLAGTSRHVACNLCRERKVRCDGAVPSCLACQKRGHECAYAMLKGQDVNHEEIAGTIRALTSRLAKAEAEIAEQRATAARPSTTASSSYVSSSASACDGPIGSEKMLRDTSIPLTIPPPAGEDTPDAMVVDSNLSAVSSAESKEGENADRLAPEVVAELHESFFACFHVPFPLLDQHRYRATWTSKLRTRGGKALVYAVWMLGASSSTAHPGLHRPLYLRCKRSLEQAEAGASADLMSIEAAQASLLLALYEFKHMHFARAWLSHARALRLVRMLRLHRLDETPRTYPSPAQPRPGSDVSSRNEPDDRERRQTFWVAFILDRLSNTGTDWPTTFEENEIMTLLPLQGPDEAGNGLYNPASASLSDLLEAKTPPPLSPFAAVVVMIAMWGRCVAHLYAGPISRDRGDLDASALRDFWARHYTLDATTTSTFTTYSGRLADQGIAMNDSSTLFISLLFNTILIYLHQAALVLAEGSGLSFSIAAESESRCRSAAMETADLVRTSPGLETMNHMNFFAARSLHAAARVLVQTVRRLSGDARVFDSLHCLTSNMNAQKSSNPLMELYLKHISAEFEGKDVPYPTLIPS